MPKHIPIGVDNFAELVQGDYLFCDKTLMIKEILNRGEKVTLITRSRRWGKTLNLSMLQHFFAPKVRLQETTGLFDNLKIANEDKGEYIKTYQGQYPAIFVSFKDVRESSFESALKKFGVLIQELYREHRIVLGFLEEDEKELFNKFLRSQGNKEELESAIRFLSECLYKHHKKKVWILIDEYDTPLNAAHIGGYLEELAGFMKNVFSTALKGNDALERGVLTGILRVSKDNMLTGLNNVEVYTLLDDEYKQYFGFTEEEVIELFKLHQCQAVLNDVRLWYNGYKSGDLITYNPWSIMSCLSRNGKIDIYWVHVASNDLVKQAIVASTPEAQTQIATLIRNESIQVNIHKHVTFDMLGQDETVLWSLLLFTGYLKAESVEFNEEDAALLNCRVSIPNREVLSLYKQYINEWLRTKLGPTKYQSFIENLIEGNAAAFTENLGNLLLESASIFDVGYSSKGEQFYHGIMLGLLASLQSTHMVTSNRESGTGRYDMAVIPKAGGKRDLGIILEFKRAKESENTKDVAIKALQQIQDNLYSKELKNHPQVKRVLEVGIAFSGKSAISAYEMYPMGQRPVTSSIQLSRQISKEFGIRSADEKNEKEMMEIDDEKESQSTSSLMEDRATSSVSAKRGTKRKAEEKKESKEVKARATSSTLSSISQHSFLSSSSSTSPERRSRKHKKKDNDDVEMISEETSSMIPPRRK